MTIPRRDRLDLFTPAERAIWDAAQAVERAGCDVRLTSAVNLLHEARAQVADYVDGVKHEPKPFGHISKADECQVDQPRCGHCNSENCTYVDHGNGCFGSPNDAGDALERAALQFHEHRTLARNKKRVTVLRREVRRLNAKVAAQAVVLRQLGSPDHWKAVRAMAAQPVLDGAAMWELRKALGLTACEVSHDDVIRAAARRLALEGKP